MQTKNTKKYRRKKEGNGEISGAYELATQTPNPSNLLTRDGSFSIPDSRLADVLTKLLQALTIPALLVDEDYQIVFANQACVTIGASRESLPGTSVFHLTLSKDDSVKLEEIARAAFASRKHKVFDAPFDLNSCNGPRRCQATLMCLRIVKQRYLFVLVEDLTGEQNSLLTGQKNQEELCRLQGGLKERVDARMIASSLTTAELNQLEDQCRRFIDNCPALIWLKDEHGRYSFCNQTFERRFGISPEFCIGRTDQDFWPKEVAKFFWINDQTVISSRNVLEVVEEAIDNQGNTSFWSVVKFPCSEAQGLRHVGGIGIEITAQYLAEKAQQGILVSVENQLKELHLDLASRLQTSIMPIINQLQCKATSLDTLQLLRTLEYHVTQTLKKTSSKAWRRLLLLSPREMRVCNLIIAGLTSKEIADLIGVTPEAVSSYRHRIRRKLGADTLGQDLGKWLRLLYESD